MSTPSRDDSSQFQVRRFSDIAGDVLRERILSGALAPGARLNEVTLSEQLRISRPPLREALRVLSGEGIVQIIPGRGTFVAQFDIESVLQLGDVRIALECATARLAAERAEEEDLVGLSAVMSEIEVELQGRDEPYPRHIDFHALLAEASRSPRLAQAVDEVDKQLQLARARSGNDPERARQALIEHRVICDAVVRRDPDAAETAMRTHIEASMQAMIALIREGQKAEELE